MRALVVASAIFSVGCVSVPGPLPPVPPLPGVHGRAAAMLYDTAEQSSGLDGVMVAASATAHVVELGFHLQLSNGLLGPRFIGGGLNANLTLEIDEDFLIGLGFETTWLDQFTWVDGFRSPTVWGGASVPFIFRFSDVAWVWIKPALGLGLSAHLFSIGGQAVPRIGLVFPGLRLSYGASLEVLPGVNVFGESSTTVPFGGGYLALGTMLSF